MDGSSNAIKQVLRQNRKQILSDLEDWMMVVESLYQKDILGKRQYQEIKSKVIQFDAVTLILDCIETASFRGFLAFCDALKEDYSWLETKLLETAKNHGLDLSKFDMLEYQASEPILTDKLLKSIPSERELLKISKCIASLQEGEILAYDLGLAVTEIERIKHGSLSTVLKIHSMLITWRRLKADSATYQILLTALRNCDMQHVICSINEFIS